MPASTLPLNCVNWYVAGDAGQPWEGQEHADNDEGEAKGGEQGAGGDEVEPRGAAAEVQPGEAQRQSWQVAGGYFWQVSKEREEIQERFSTAILEIQQKAGLK